MGFGKQAIKLHARRQARKVRLQSIKRLPEKSKFSIAWTQECREQSGIPAMVGNRKASETATCLAVTEKDHDPDGTKPTGLPPLLFFHRPIQPGIAESPPWH
jgi:hypothetical protein